MGGKRERKEEEEGEEVCIPVYRLRGQFFRGGGLDRVDPTCRERRREHISLLFFFFFWSFVECCVRDGFAERGLTPLTRYRQLALPF